MKELTGDWEFDFPSYLVGGIDQEASRADHIFLVEHEISLYEEGEESDIVNSDQLQYCKKYVDKYG